MKAILDKAKQTKLEVNVLQEEMKTKLTNKFGELMQDIFNHFEGLESISWTQYTSTWCDGEPCTMSCNFDYADIEGGNENAVSDLLSQISNIFTDEDFDTIFGQPVTVTVTKEGIETEPFEDFE